jgi:hypothetical protein
MSRIILELDDEEASILYRALVEQFKDWVFSRLDGKSEENDKMLAVAERLATRISDAMKDGGKDNSKMRDMINGLEGENNV